MHDDDDEHGTSARWPVGTLHSFRHARDVARPQAGVDGPVPAIVANLIRLDTAAAFNVSAQDVAVRGMVVLPRRVLRAVVSATLGVDVAPGASREEIDAALEVQRLSADQPIEWLATNPDAFFGRTTKVCVCVWGRPRGVRCQGRDVDLWMFVGGHGGWEGWYRHGASGARGIRRLRSAGRFMPTMSAVRGLPYATAPVLGRRPVGEDPAGTAWRVWAGGCDPEYLCVTR